MVASSKLFRRGSIILNLIAMHHCGLRHPGASGSGKVTVSVLRPRFRSDDLTDPILNASSRLSTRCTRRQRHHVQYAQARFPTRAMDRPQKERTIGGARFERATHSSVRFIQGYSPSMSRLASGDGRSCIGMGQLHQSYDDQILWQHKVHAMSNIVKYVEKYLWAAPTEAPYTTMMDLVFKPNRLFPAPVEGVSDSDYAFAMDLRKSLLGSDTCMNPFVANAGPFQGQEITTFTHSYIVKDNIKYSSSLLLLHLFLVRYGVYDRSYLPVATRGRKYAYVDTKIAHFLFPNDASIDKPKVEETSVASSSSPIDQDDEDENDTEDSSVSVGEVLGITPTQFNSTRRRVSKGLRCRRRTQG